MSIISALDTAIRSDPRDLPRIAQGRTHPPAGRGGASTGGLAETPAARAAARISAVVPAEHEAELAAMQAVLGELLPLTGPARARVIKWVEEVLGPQMPDPQPETDEVDL